MSDPYSDPYEQRDIARRLEQTQTKEVPGGIAGFSTFYDSGTFVPTLVGSGTAGSFTYDATNTGGRWSRIGNRVLLSGRVRITAIGVAPTGNLGISGLPVVSAASGQQVAGGLAVLSYTGITLTGARTQLNAIITDAVSTALIFESGSNLATAVVQGTGLVLVGGVGDIRFEGQYYVA